jgi:hypothetical protein
MGFEATMDIVGLWIGALLTMAIFSFLYKDNPVYKFAEHLFVGVAAGYTVAKIFWDVFVGLVWLKFRDLSPEATTAEQAWTYLLILPTLIGCLFFARFHQKSAWISRWAIAFVVGAYAGVNLTGYFHSDLIVQTEATFLMMNPAKGVVEGGEPQGWVSLLVFQIPILIGVLSTLTYFFFSKPHRGAIGVTARVGIFFLMAAFGASFGYTVMARISLFIGRVQFLFTDWLGIV